MREICQPKAILEGPVEDWYSRTIERKISIYFTKILIILGLSPNQASMFSLLMILIGGLLFTKSTLIFTMSSLLLFQLSFILDNSDGELSRYYNKHTYFGYILESIYLPIFSVVIDLSLAIRLWMIDQLQLYLCIGFLGAITDTFISLIRSYSRGLTDLLDGKLKHSKGIHHVVLSLKLDKIYEPRGKVFIFITISIFDLIYSYNILKYVLYLFSILGFSILVGIIIIAYINDFVLSN